MQKTYIKCIFNKLDYLWSKFELYSNSNKKAFGDDPLILFTLYFVSGSAFGGGSASALLGMMQNIGAAFRYEIVIFKISISVFSVDQSKFNILELLGYIRSNIILTLNCQYIKYVSLCYLTQSISIQRNLLECIYHDYGSPFTAPRVAIFKGTNMYYYSSKYLRYVWFRISTMDILYILYFKIWIYQAILIIIVVTF